MRHITTMQTLSVTCWTVTGGLMTCLHLYGPNPYIRAWLMISLAAAVTATLSARLDRSGPQAPQAPLGATYDLGWQQGYRTAAAEYLGLIAQLRQQLHVLKGHAHGKDQPPAEG